MTKINYEGAWRELTRLLDLTSHLLSGGEIREEMENIEQRYYPKEEEHPTPYADRGLDGTMDMLNEYRRKNLKEIARLEALIKEESKCDHCGYKQIATSLKGVWGKLTP